MAVSETLTQYTTPLSSDSSQALPTFPPRPTSLPLQYTEIPRRNWVKQLKDEEPKDKNLNFFYSCLSLDLMRLLVSHCVTMTCSSHRNESKSKLSHAPQGIFTLDALPAATLYFRAWEPAQNMPACTPRG